MRKSFFLNIGFKITKITGFVFSTVTRQWNVDRVGTHDKLNIIIIIYTVATYSVLISVMV